MHRDQKPFFRFLTHTRTHSEFATLQSNLTALSMIMGSQDFAIEGATALLGADADLVCNPANAGMLSVYLKGKVVMLPLPSNRSCFQV
jgi:hypothetical protein